MDALIILIDVRAPQRAYLTALLAVVGSIGGNLARVMRYGGEAYLAIRLPRMRVTF